MDFMSWDYDDRYLPDTFHERQNGADEILLWLAQAPMNTKNGTLTRDFKVLDRVFLLAGMLYRDVMHSQMVEPGTEDSEHPPFIVNSQMSFQHVQSSLTKLMKKWLGEGEEELDLNSIGGASHGKQAAKAARDPSPSSSQPLEGPNKVWGLSQFSETISDLP